MVPATRRSGEKHLGTVRGVKRDTDGEHLRRVRRICSALPDTTEKLSHGEPTFFVQKKVFVMFADNHHNDGHVAVWIPTQPGLQPSLIKGDPKTYFKPPYVVFAVGLASNWIASAMRIWRPTFMRLGT